VRRPLWEVHAEFQRPHLVHRQQLTVNLTDDIMKTYFLNFDLRSTAEQCVTHLKSHTKGGACNQQYTLRAVGNRVGHSVDGRKASLCGIVVTIIIIIIIIIKLPT
jgi:hypothetical protein